MPGMTFRRGGNFPQDPASNPPAFVLACLSSVFPFLEVPMRSKILASLLCVFCAAAFADESARPAVSSEKPHIDVVFCLDCSGSMGPVIETAKQKVWSIVNEIARAKPSPILRIGLL